MNFDTNDIIQVTDKQGYTLIYRFGYLDTSDETGCAYIRLHNLSSDTYISVEYRWFKEREIAKSEPGARVIRNGRTATVEDTKAISPLQYKAITGSDSVETWLWKDTMLYSTYLEQQGKSPITIVCCSRPCMHQKQGICQEKYVSISCEGCCQNFVEVIAENDGAENEGHTG